LAIEGTNHNGLRLYLENSPLQGLIKQDVLNWINREVARLGLVIEGKTVDTGPEDIPGALKAALSIAQESTPENID
jgi:hypothetical protein